MLLFVAILWGLVLIAQSVAMDYIGPLTFNFIRNVLATTTLLIYIFIRKLIYKYKGIKKENEDKKKLWAGGVLTGISLFFATALQQIGLETAAPAKAGFIASLYILFVPIIGLFLHKKAHLNIWISVFIAIIGFYLISGASGFNFGKGEIFVFISTIFFALQIIVIDKYTHFVDGIKMSCIQFAVVTILSLVPAVLEKPTWDMIAIVIPHLLFAGVIAGCMGYTIQILCQKIVNPTAASLILSLESVFSLIFAMIILKEALEFKEWIGAILIFSSVIFSQIPKEMFVNLYNKLFNKKKKEEVQ